ncbi:uncharacterized protein PHALS_02547 [Plasmopara halstedii]|uniref:Uncharacterized protein n=1 Tax=Plasmopara halstedii TaxID=4781 RepID=A0A0P1AVA5_PLAHL|nr:uncharacterized protein PHALS_02547 [Plasmopara halstedii]CEG46125.1 hypothetical protein PHALS_02547 [Plasmopara halstedii]|eukprot:XP_024582494.1 hypothetical protein PHALS_02547 [Plasmopara halstedii]
MDSASTFIEVDVLDIANVKSKMDQLALADGNMTFDHHQNKLMQQGDCDVGNCPNNLRDTNEPTTHAKFYASL